MDQIQAPAGQEDGTPGRILPLSPLRFFPHRGIYEVTDPAEIIARCTRDGVVSWQHVARQLGRSVDSVRAQFDSGYGRAWVAMPSRDLEDEEPPPDSEVPVTSPYTKGPGLKLEILRDLQHGPRSVETIANQLVRPVNSIRARLDRLLEIGAVSHDGRYPRTWSLTATGLRISVTGCEDRAKERA
jgi:hypothetical protein